jgi:anaerobic dimethyl sulfoxide reductase subunit A
MSTRRPSATGEETLVLTTSAFDCGGRCPLRVHVKDGVIARIEGDGYSDEEGQLRACWRGRAYRHWIYH